VAKRCEADTAKVEIALYGEVFPKISAPTLRFYGSEEIPGAEYCWIFLEDGGDRKCSYRRKPDRALAVEWLAALHTSAHHLDLDFLPGPDLYFASHLREGRELIAGSLDNPVFSSEHRGLLSQVVRDLEITAFHRDEVAAYCSKMPKTLVHGDFVAKNIRIKDRTGAPALLAVRLGNGRSRRDRGGRGAVSGCACLLAARQRGGLCRY
jgi:hypothetical protein